METSKPEKLDAYDLFHTETAANELIESQRTFYTMALMRREKLLASQSEKIAKLDALVAHLREERDELAKTNALLDKRIEALDARVNTLEGDRELTSKDIDSFVDLPPRMQAEEILEFKTSGE